jgi:hypothetical protein
LSKYGDLKNIKIKSLTPLDFSVFFGQKIPCMSGTGIFWSTSDENLPKKKNSTSNCSHIFQAFKKAIKF